MEDNQKYTMNIEMPIRYDDQFLEDILVTALEGGSNYWIDKIVIQPKDPNQEKPAGMPKSIWMFEIIKYNGYLLIYNGDDIKLTRTLRMRDLQNGIEKYIQCYKNDVLNIFCDGLTLDAGQFDANMADCVLQYAVFNELIYG